MHPLVRLGADSPFGLALPSGTPTASQLYAPRGVWFDDDTLIVVDSGNHRVLIWHGLPANDGAPADVVLGQPSFESEGAAAGGTSRTNGLHLPTGVLVHDGRLVVADAWHHRVLVWDRIPEASGMPPSYVIGQATLEETAPNRGGVVSRESLYWPYGVGVAAGWFWIADTGNRRVLGWPSLPDAGELPHVVLGQDDFARGDENRGGDVSSRSFRWPHAIAGDDMTMYVADAGNHRVIGWQGRPDASRPPDLLIGQKDWTSNEEIPHRKQGAHRLRFPYAVALARRTLFVADTANNRVLAWSPNPVEGIQPAAHAVIGQRDFDAAGENQWKAVAPDTTCWPYGIWAHGDRLAIADSGNNRVVLWNVAQPHLVTPHPLSGVEAPCA